MYDNINLENVIIQSNKQPKEEKMLNNNNEQSEAVLQANHQVSSKGATGLIKYSSPKTKFFDNIGFQQSHPMVHNSGSIGSQISGHHGNQI